jgi:heparin/heparan-sulfate lyase
MIIMVFVAALSGVSVFAAGNLLDTSGFPEPSFTPPPSHPRLFFQASDIPRILENKTKPENAAALTMHQSNLNLTHTGILPTPSPGTSNHNSTILGYIESWAFEYATMGDAAQGNKAVTAIKNYAQTVQYVNPLSDAYVRQGGYFILTAAKVYDWCYDLLDSNDKSMLIERVETICEEGFDIGWPPLAKGAVSGHSSEAQFLCDVTAAAIAFYDERPDIYHVVFGRFMKEYVPARKYYYPGGWLHQGSLYGTYRGGFDFISTFIWARAGLPMVYGPEQQYLAYYCLYMRRPDGKMFADGDATVSGSGFTAWKNQARLLLPAANYYKDPYLKGETIRQKLYQSMMIGYGANATRPWIYLIMNDPDIIPAPLEDLPKTKIFRLAFWSYDCTYRLGYDEG